MREAYGGRAPAAKITGRSLLPKVLPGVHSKAGEGGVMAQKWPQTVGVEFSEVMEHITAIIYDRHSHKVLAAVQDSQPNALMRQVRKAGQRHKSQALFPRPWPPRMDRFVRNLIADTRQRMPDFTPTITRHQMRGQNASDLKSKPELAPRCDVHAHAEMTPCQIEIRDDGSPTPFLREMAHRCTVPGCVRFFWRNLGYQQQGWPLNSHLIRCGCHGAVRPFMIVRPVGASFSYVCPVEGCMHTRRWSAQFDTDEKPVKGE